MKTLPSALATHVATRSTTLASALKITRPDSTIYGFTTHDVDDPVSGVTYKANPGLDVTAIVIAANAAVGNLQLTTLHDGTVFTTADILGGRWRNSAFEIFAYNYANLTGGIEIKLAGTLGEVSIKQNSVVAELRDFRQYLQQAVGSASSKTCRYRLGSTDKNNGGLCMKDISGFAVVGANVIAVTDKRIFTSNLTTLALHWFSEGYLTWTSGNNNGLTAKVKYYDDGTGGGTNGTFFLALPMLSTIQVGDTFTPVVGCQKRREEDCRDKFANAINFGGEPDRKGVNNLTQAPPIQPAEEGGGK